MVANACIYVWCKANLNYKMLDSPMKRKYNRLSLQNKENSSLFVRITQFFMNILHEIQYIIYQVMQNFLLNKVRLTTVFCVLLMELELFFF